MTSLATHFKKVTTGNNVFIVSVIVYRNCHIMHFLHQMFNVSALLLDDAWMDGWLGFNGILSTQIAAISCLRKFKVC